MNPTPGQEEHTFYTCTVHPRFSLLRLHLYVYRYLLIKLRCPLAIWTLSNSSGVYVIGTSGALFGPLPLLKWSGHLIIRMYITAKSCKAKKKPALPITCSPKPPPRCLLKPEIYPRPLISSPPNNSTTHPISHTSPATHGTS